MKMKNNKINGVTFKKYSSKICEKCACPTAYKNYARHLKSKKHVGGGEKTKVDTKELKNYSKSCGVKGIYKMKKSELLQVRDKVKESEF